MAWCFHDWEVVRTMTQSEACNAALDRIDGYKRCPVRHSGDARDHVDRVCLKCGAADLGIERAIEYAYAQYVYMNRRKSAAAEIYKRITGESVDGKAIQPN